MKEQTSRREFLGRSLKTGLAAAVGLTLPSIFLNKICKGDKIMYKTGKLMFYNGIADMIGNYWPLDIIQRQGGLEGYDGNDSPYNNGPPVKPNPKILSVIQGHFLPELDTDSRPLESFTPVNLELSVDTGGGSITISCQNNLWCSIDPSNGGYDFGIKPITLWRRFPAEPDKLQFLADIREAHAKSDFIGGDGIKYALVPLPNLNNTYENQVPYDFLQLRFDVYPGDLDLQSRVDLNDFSHLAKDWGRQGEPKEFLGDITGPLGLPDGNVDASDLELLTRYWLKDIRDIMPSP